ncbi:MAG TPA: tRNA dihydrouridine synthase DusB [Microvirga sp.]|jgi:nifR3 family TIM-barrel protein|nr:tRNA dihydrouridine synthase DusB [Microvirga sp.]
MNCDYKSGGFGFVIGGLAIDGRAVLAPLSGVTDVVMRRIARRHGAGLVVSEMVASDELVLGSEEAQLRAEGEGIEPHVVQLAGCEPRWMGEAARVAEAAGADIIDINMGCPAKRVTGGYAGSALMRDLDQACRIIQATVDAATVPVTVKMRLGWDHGSINAPELARRAQDLGVKAVTVHGRTRQQFYKGTADWAAIAPVVGAVGIPVTANGDIHSAEDAARCLAASGAAAVMVGRAALGQPWLVGRIGAALDGRTLPEPAPEVRAAVAVEHYEGLLSLYGVAMGVRHARKHLAAYADVAQAAGFGVGEEDRRTIVTTETPAVVVRILRDLYARPTRKAA